MAGGVRFYADTHTYLNDKGETYISVTTLIKKYTPPFERDYWSSYKALKDVLSEAGIWEEYKKKAGGWEAVVEYCRGIKNFPYTDAVIQRKRYYLATWDDKSAEALSKGSAFHKMAEARAVNSRMILPDLREVEVLTDTDILALPEFEKFGLFPELVIYNHDHHLAGQADYVLKEGNVVHIKDYKTSKEITRSAFQEQTLLEPLNHLPNANFFTYSMQLSLYGWMLEEKGYKVGSLAIEHVINEHQSKLIPVTYLKKEVRALLAHYEGKRKDKWPKTRLPDRKVGFAFVSSGPQSGDKGR